MRLTGTVVPNHFTSMLPSQFVIPYLIQGGKSRPTMDCRLGSVLRGRCHKPVILSYLSLAATKERSFQEVKVKVIKKWIGRPLTPKQNGTRNVFEVHSSDIGGRGKRNTIFLGFAIPNVATLQSQSELLKIDGYWKCRTLSIPIWVPRRRSSTNYVR